MYDNPEALFGGRSQLLSLISLIYGAVEDVSLWPSVMNAIAEAVQGEATVLFTNYTGVETSNIATHSRIDPTALISYAEYYGAKNVLISRGDQVFADGEPRFSHQSVPNCELEKTEYYDGYLIANNIYYGLGIKIALQEHAPALLSSLRPKWKGPFEEREGDIFSTLLPHLQRALRLHTQLSHLRSKTNGLEAALSAFDIAVFGLNCKADVIFLNQGARLLSDANDGIAVRRNRLMASHSGQHRELQSLIANTIAPAANHTRSPGGSMLLHRRSGRPELRLTIIPFRSSSLPDLDQVAALVFLSDSTTKTLSRAVTLRALYGLSPSESRLSDLMASGYELSAAAEQMGTTLTTARFHLKSIFSKTKVNKQAKLVRLILSLPGQPLSFLSDTRDSAPLSPPEGERRT